MAKSIMLGNGSLLVGLDQFGQLKDFYYPYAGLENHVNHTMVHKIGVYLDEQFSWLDDGTWDIQISCEKDTMASNIIAKHATFGLEIHFLDIVYNEEPVFIRELSIKNTFDRKRKVKVFFNQQFNISQNIAGDTAYYDPVDNVVIHYKGRRAFVVNVREGKNGVDDYCVGLLGIEGKEGTYKDSEDGRLSKNPVEHGRVDSVISITVEVSAKDESKIYYWITAAKTIEKAKLLNESIIVRAPSDVIKTTRDYWRAWVNISDVSLKGLDESSIDLFKKSLLYIRTHVNDNGSIIASGDSDMYQFGRDTYAYVWPRDGAYAALALEKYGDSNAPRRFFMFCNDILSEKGYFMHKYRPDKALGSSWHPWTTDNIAQLPIQEDETAIVLFALWEHYHASHDLEFIESIYNSFIKKAAEFMANYRDEKTGLPKASYDLWEMYYGISTYTASSVYGALIVASKFAKLLGKETHAKEYEEAAETIKKGILKYLYDEESGTFYKYIQTGKKDAYIDKALDFSSIYGIYKFGVLDPTDKKLKKAFNLYVDRLLVKTDISGIARYEGDIYHHKGGDYPGNPWIVTTMWLTQYLIANAEKESDLTEVKKWISWVSAHASSSGVLPEQLDPFTGAHLSATPLIWSHAEYITTIISYLEKCKELGISKE